MLPVFFGLPHARLSVVSFVPPGTCDLKLWEDIKNKVGSLGQSTRSEVGFSTRVTAPAAGRGLELLALGERHRDRPPRSHLRLEPLDPVDAFGRVGGG